MDMVKNSPEGFAAWACKGVDMRRGSPAGQAFARSLKGNRKWEKAYPMLLESMKLEFRQSWQLSKSWSFTDTMRISIQSHEKTETNAGEWLTPLSIAKKLGGSDNPTALRMTVNYCKSCYEEGGEAFCAYNSWLKSPVFLFVRALTESSSRQRWQEIVKSHTTQENIWDQKLLESKAIRHYAHAKGLELRNVSTDDVKADPLGLDGWAKIQLVASQGTPAETAGLPPASIVTPKRKGEGDGTGAKATPKAKAKAAQKKEVTSTEEGAQGVKEEPGEEGAPSAAVPKQRRAAAKNPLVEAEKEARALLGAMHKVQTDFGNIKALIESATKDEAKAWAREMFGQAEAKIEHLDAQIDTQKDFVRQLQHAILMPNGVKELKAKLTENVLLQKLSLVIAAFKVEHGVGEAEISKTTPTSSISLNAVLAIVARLERTKRAFDDSGDTEATPKAKAKGQRQKKQKINQA